MIVIVLIVIPAIVWAIAFAVLLGRWVGGEEFWYGMLAAPVPWRCYSTSPSPTSTRYGIGCVPSWSLCP